MASGPVKCVAPIGSVLGEGPVWSPDGAALWFVDIKGCAIHQFHPQTSEHKTWSTPSSVGWILPIASGGWMVGLKSGLHLFDPITGSFTLYAEVEADLPNNRLNDATCSRAGGLWFGTMDDGEGADTGRIYKLNGGLVIDSGLPPVCITNGPAISPNGKVLYHTDR
jgi:xylono-1,5-lactonase